MTWYVLKFYYNIQFSGGMPHDQLNSLWLNNDYVTCAGQFCSDAVF